MVISQAQSPAAALEAPYPPAHLGLQWRALLAKDLTQVATLVGQCEDADRALVRCEDRELADLVEFGMGDTGGDAIIGFDSTGVARAVAWVEVTCGSDGSGCARVNAFVHPTVRGRGIGRAVLKWQDCRSRHLLHAARSGCEGTGARIYNLVDAHVNERRRLYMAAGFSPQRTFEVLTCQLPLPASEPTPVAQLKASHGIEIQAWDMARLEQLEHLNYDVFALHWGQQADLRQWWQRALTVCDPRWSWVAVDDADEVVGYILTSRRPAQWIATGQAEARGELLGVAPAMRGRGIARELLRRSMQSAYECGANTFTICAEDNNPQGAHDFYQRHGFSVVGEQVYYAMELD